jgi:hypothetical protein
VNLHDMPSPGPITRAQTLVMEAFRAINYTRVIIERQPDSDSGDQLRQFFLDCAKKCPRAKPAVKKAGSDPAPVTVTKAAGGRRST